MKTFVNIADLGSFSRAAGALGMSSGMATRHISMLENHLGTRLINRTTRTISLTKSGLIYLEQARVILDALEEAEQSMKLEHECTTGTVRIVARVEFGLHHLAPALKPYLRRYPNVVVDVTLLDRPVNLVDEGFDIGILAEQQIVGTSVIARRLARDHMTICAASVYLKTHGTPRDPKQLSAHAWLGSSGHVVEHGVVFNTAAGNVRVKPTCIIVANDASVLRQCALLGMGIAALPDAMITEDVRCGALIPLLTDFPLPFIENMLVYSNRRHMPPSVRNLIDHLRRHFVFDSDSPLQCSPR